MPMIPRVEPALVQRQIERIVASRQFVRSDRMCHFLRFIVEEWLRNPDARPKETIVATQVFKRGTNYDPATDPVVRVEARRLRAKLEEYYASDGSEDLVRIHLPKGGYTPAVELRPPRPDDRWC